MGLMLIMITAVGLAMDCFAVSISAGACTKKAQNTALLKMALMFGIFQSGMTLIGWFAGNSFASVISGFDHWVAFGLLAFVGGKMLVEGIKEDEERKETDFCSTKTILVLSVATSIDALAVGVSFSVLDAGPVLPAAVIGAASFLFSLAGAVIGRKTGQILGNKAEILGGIILIGIGVKILLEHIAG